ncbi:CAP domain-containing protein [Mycolicibacterium sp. 018/SC-01/001]|uniref:CAP domain-containing protein n=1 Tax=Mycolicibacterium sp. 018/SC-01/001 TaxID=2592069 RepID=UPI0011803161|nr:CAP domain-containing protein [Mycolicibacterium sp. 018/SC-01/001]TRW78838.1 CAP domain-containing protein [Mycolicibacterium sp. 018/SC-01/001]
MAVRAVVSSAVAATIMVATMATAHADDPLAPIRGTVNQERARTACAPLAYNPALEAAAQQLVRAPSAQAFQVTGYDGTTVKSWGYGDPEEKAITSAFANGAFQNVNNCSLAEYGVGFIRNEEFEEDTVAIVFGTPRAVPAPPAPDLKPTLTPIPAAEPPLPPTNAVQVSFTRGVLQWTVTVTSTADIPGTCTYAATNPVLPGTNRNFTIDPKGTANLTVTAPPPLSAYHVVVACSGPFNGKTVEFGRVEQDVRA